METFGGDALAQLDLVVRDLLAFRLAQLARAENKALATSQARIQGSLTGGGQFSKFPQNHTGRGGGMAPCPPAYGPATSTDK